VGAQHVCDSYIPHRDDFHTAAVLVYRGGDPDAASGQQLQVVSQDTHLVGSRSVKDYRHSSGRECRALRSGHYQQPADPSAGGYKLQVPN